MPAIVRTFLPGLAIFAILLMSRGLVWAPDATRFEPTGPASGVAVRTPDPKTDRQLASFVTDILDGESPGAPAHPALAGEPGPAYAALRSDGVRRAEGWGVAATRAEAVRKAIHDAAAALAEGESGKIDVVELSIGSPVDSIDEPSEQGRLTNVHRGILGLEVEFDGRTARFAPTQMIANNLSFEVALGHASEKLDAAPGALQASAQISTFGAEQLLVHVPDQSITWMLRGNEVIAPEAVTAASTRELASSLGDWLQRNVQPDGRMTYKYWPSRGEESTADNTVRQWMATVALGRMARHRDDDGLLAVARRNIEYNLETYYEQEGGLGLIVERDGDVKLGAVALAALALREHPERADFAAEEAALRRTVDSLWNPDGSFRTFHRPEGRNDNQNFYPGEALLLWAAILRDEPSAQLQHQFARSFEYYRDWHRENRNPAFIPWHTQAYVAVWELTGDEDLKSFVFEMNDWLLPMQQWDGAEYPDLRGRFYDPDNPGYGPPHSSSDGVYLEGLIAAYRLAVAVDDADRAERYRTAITRVVRNAMQLHFADHVDMYYVSRSDPVLGGVRTTPYDNEIRVDNVQHTLMGLLDVIESFLPSDYAGL